MGNKLNSMNTRLGDDGATDIGDRLRLAKNHERVEAYGAIDELNCAIGMVVAKAGLPKAVFECLLQVQRELIDLAGELYVPKRMVMASVHVERLERELDAFNQPLQSLKESILPGGGPMAAACHFARAVARRAERRTWTLVELEEQIAGSDKLLRSSQNTSVNPEILRYLNRLSDLLLAVAQTLARQERGS